uniref:Calmodulin-lysine N-methyltransferase n=1 Tax=Panagrolaimus superbus TaxID=310955 RepID=A0A914YTG6_9BILA
MNDEDSRSNDAPGPSRAKHKKRHSDDKDTVADDESLNIKRTAAKRRWGILSDHLTKKVRSSDDDIVTSTFNTYGLHELEQIGQDTIGTWFKLRWKEKDEWPTVELRLIDKFRFDVMDLSGFNNTGNIRIWPAEECLAYYLLENRQLYEGKSVLEIGGGQSGLAENLETIITHNKLEEKCHGVFHRWNEPLPESLSTKQFDLVIAADCYFDPDFHESFIDTLVSSLSPTGTALLFSPERGGTLRSFIEKLFQRNVFNVEQTANICEGITSKISAITASSSIEDFDSDKDHVFDQKLIYHTYLSAQDLKENQKYHNIEFDADTLVRISGIVKAVLTEKWLPELNSFSDIKNRGVEDVDISLLFRNHPKFYAKEYEEDDDEEEEEENEELEEELDQDFEDIQLRNSLPETPSSFKKKKSESPLITDYFDKPKDLSTESHLTPEPPMTSTFSSSKRPAPVSTIHQTPAKLSKRCESLTETQALKHCFESQKPAVNQSIPLIPSAAKPLVFQNNVKPVPPQSPFVQPNLQIPKSSSKITMAPAVITPKLLPPIQVDHDSFDDDDDFIEAVCEIRKPVIQKPLPPRVIQKRDSFYDEDSLSPIKIVQNGHSKVATVSKPAKIERKDSFDDEDSDIIYLEPSPPSKINVAPSKPAKASSIPPPRNHSFVSNKPKLNKTPTKSNPLSDASNKGPLKGESQFT